MSFRPYKPPAPYASSKDVVARLIDALGVKLAAFKLQVSERSVYNYGAADHDTQMTYDQVRLLTIESGATIAAEILSADAGGVFVPVAAPVDTLTELSARLCDEHGQFSGRLMRALSDGTVDAAEAGDLLKELDDLLRAGLAARTHVQRLIKGDPS